MSLAPIEPRTSEEGLEASARSWDIGDEECNCMSKKNHINMDTSRTSGGAVLQAGTAGIEAQLSSLSIISKVAAVQSCALGEDEQPRLCNIDCK